MFGRQNAYTTRSLSLLELDKLLDHLANVDEAWFLADPQFKIIPIRYWNADSGSGFWSEYKVRFPGRIWSKIKLTFTDELTVERIVGGHNDQDDQR